MNYLSTGSSSDNDARNDNFPSTLAGVLKWSGLGVAGVDGEKTLLLDVAGLLKGEVETGTLDFGTEHDGVSW